MLNRLFYYKVDCPESSGRWVDLRDAQDDKTILKNPHRGWYWHYIDGGFSDQRYRKGYEEQLLLPNGQTEDIVITDDVSDFPGLNHIYLRFNWGDIEKEEGKLDWSYIDRIFDKWGALGYSFALRVCTFMGDLSYATPKWVISAGAKYKEVEVDGRICMEPVYDDPVYLEKLENFMVSYGKKFNGHPLVEYVDVGTFGTWGESSASSLYPVEVLKKHFDLHADNFPDTFVLMNDDAIPNRSGREIVPGESQALAEYAIEKGFGLRDDSICYMPYVKYGSYDGLLVPSLYDAFYNNGPIDVEFCHYSYYTSDEFIGIEGIEPSLFQDGYRALEAIIRGRVTYAGFHGYPREFLQNYKSLAWYCANRLGYWYFIEGVLLPELKSGRINEFTLLLSNRGFAHCSVRYDLRLKLVEVNSGASYVIDCPDVDNRKWEPVYCAALDNCIKQPLSLDLTNVPSGEYELQIGLFEKNRPIRFGMCKELDREGGFIGLTNMTC